VSLHKPGSPKIKIREIQARRERVKMLFLQFHTEEDIGKQLGVDQSVVSRDIQAIKQESTTNFIYQLAKSDLAYHYKNEIDTINEVKRLCFSIYNNVSNDTINIDRVKLAALKIVLDGSEARFRMLTEGPAIMALKALSERLDRLENGQEGNGNDGSNGNGRNIKQKEENS
jgi:hypothetical protein